MAITAGNLLLGIGVVEVDGSDIGATTGGMSVSKTLEHFFHDVDQYLDAVEATPTNVQMQISTEIAEATLENIRIAWNELNAPAGGILQVGINPNKAERTLSIEGRKSTGTAAGSDIGSREYYFFRCFIVDEVSTSVMKTDSTRFPVTFRILPDTLQPAGGEYGTIQDF